MAGDRRSHRQILQAIEESICFDLFAGPKTRIHFGDIDSTSSQQMPLDEKSIEKFGSAGAPVQVIEGYRGIEKDCRHQAFWRRMALPNRWSGSERIFSTQAAPPFISSG